MGLAENIKRIRNQYGMSQADFGKIAGVSDKAVSTWENGSKEPRMGTIQKIADYFGIQKSDIIEDTIKNTGYIPVFRTAPVVGTVRCGQPMLAEENIEEYRPIPYNDREKYIWLRARGDSMNAAGIADSDMLLVRVQSEVSDKQVAVVCVNGDEATVKRFHQQGDMVMLIPDSYNQDHQIQIYNLKDTPIHIVGRVVKIEKDVW